MDSTFTSELSYSGIQHGGIIFWSPFHGPICIIYKHSSLRDLQCSNSVTTWFSNHLPWKSSSAGVSGYLSPEKK